MWLQTRIGFFSIVSKPGDTPSGQLTIRARVQSDLVSLGKRYLPELEPIVCSPHNDYRYRASAPKEAIARAFARMATDIDYGNFKDTVAQEQGKVRAQVYGRVWGVLYELQNQGNHEKVA